MKTLLIILVLFTFKLTAQFDTLRFTKRIDTVILYDYRYIYKIKIVNNHTYHWNLIKKDKLYSYWKDDKLINTKQ